jgi:hypothetical protein
MKPTMNALMFAALLAVSAVAATPAFAQTRQREHSDRRDSRVNGERAVQRSPERPVVVAPRAVSPTIVRPNAVRPYDSRPYAHAPYYARPHDARPYYVRPYYARRYYAQRYYAHPYYARPYYVRPYVFRPRVTVGFGIVAGYPVPYPYAYPYPLPVYGYSAPAAPVVVGPNSTQYGGASLEISPPDASVYVDGGYAGTVGDFDGTRETLTLSTGRHHVEITAPGFQPMTFDVDVVPGRVVPYQGSLQPSRS